MISASHAKYSIHICLIEIIVDLKRRFPSLNTANILSDVVPSQFKQQFSFANLTFLSNDYNVNLIWNFFSNGVDRGTVDRVRRTFKRLVWNDVMANWYIMHGARDSVNYINSVEMNINTIYIFGGSTISAIRSSSPL